MATHQMIALKPLSYGGKKLKANDTFEAKGPHARVLVALKKAKLNDAPEKPAAKPAPKPIAKTLAQPVAKAETPATTEPAPESTAVGGMTTKTYKTRDLKPE